MNNNKNNIKRRRKGANTKGNKVKTDVKQINATLDDETKVDKINNDPSWYFSDQVLADQVSSFSFNQFLGTKDTFAEVGMKQYDIPYAMRLLFNPCPGWTEGQYGSAGINIAAMKMYTKLSSMNAKTTQYAPQDLVTLMLALGEVISMSEFGRRALGLAFTYNKRNWAFPRDIIGAAGFDPDYLLDDLAQHRMEFNVVVNMINQIAFPADVSYFQKCGYMYSHIFMDSESPMAQAYVYVPYTTWIVDDASYDQGTILKTETVLSANNVKLQWSEYITKLTNMIQAILNSASFQYIYADVLRLYEGSRLLTIPFVEESYIVMPEYDPLALLQINNAVSLGAPVGSEYEEGRITPFNDVYPSVDKNALVYMPQFTEWPGAFANWSRVINFPHSMGNPDVTQRIEATRFTAILNSEGTGSDYWVSSAALPDHYLTGIYIFGATDPVGIAKTVTTPTAISSASMARTADQFGKFNDAPRFYVVNDDSTQLLYTIGDLDYFTTIDFAYLFKVNNLVYTSLMSMTD